MRRYWLSWYQAGPDYRPLTHPPNKAVLGWWYTGDAYCAAHKDVRVICALVEAKSENAAWVAVLKEWPDMIDRRFAEAKCADYMPPSDRFPLSNWMRARMCLETVTKAKENLRLVEALLSRVCVCGKAKAKARSFCGTCYRALPADMQRALYRRLGHGYAEAYAGAVAKLKKIGRIKEVKTA